MDGDAAVEPRTPPLKRARQTRSRTAGQRGSVSIFKAALHCTSCAYPIGMPGRKKPRDPIDPRILPTVQRDYQRVPNNREDLQVSVEELDEAEQLVMHWLDADTSDDDCGGLPTLAPRAANGSAAPAADEGESYSSGSKRKKRASSSVPPQDTGVCFLLDPEGRIIVSDDDDAPVVIED